MSSPTDIHFYKPDNTIDDLDVPKPPVIPSDKMVYSPKSINRPPALNPKNILSAGNLNIEENRLNNHKNLNSNNRLLEKSPEIYSAEANNAISPRQQMEARKKQITAANGRNQPANQFRTTD